MVSKKQVNEVISKLKINKPETMKNFVQNSEKGLGLVLSYIYNHPNTYALGISQKMQISRARVTVILHKLEERGLIKKIPSPADARIEILSVTDKGKKEVDLQKNRIINMVTDVLEKVGYEEVNAFIDTSIKIRKIIDEFEKNHKNDCSRI